MSLSAAAKDRYQRQLLLVEIGEEGQARLLHTRFTEGQGSEPRAYATAAEYLRRAGCTEAPEGIPVPVPSRDAVEAFAGGNPRYREAASLILGALSAVEFLKGTLDVPQGSGVPEDLTLFRRVSERQS